MKNDIDYKAIAADQAKIDAIGERRNRQMNIKTRGVEEVHRVTYMQAYWTVEADNGRTYTGTAEWREGDDDSGFEVMFDDELSDNLEAEINDALYQEYVA